MIFNNLIYIEAIVVSLHELYILSEAFHFPHDIQLYTQIYRKLICLWSESSNLPNMGYIC